MFELSWAEILLLAVVTLVCVGPKELPVFLRTLGRYAGMARRQAAEFREQFDAAMREAEFAQMKEEMEKMQASVDSEVKAAEQSFREVESSSQFDPRSITSPPLSVPTVAGGPVAAAAAEAAPLSEAATAEAQPPMPLPAPPTPMTPAETAEPEAVREPAHTGS